MVDGTPTHICMTQSLIDPPFKNLPPVASVSKGVLNWLLHVLLQEFSISILSKEIVLL